MFYRRLDWLFGKSWSHKRSLPGPVRKRIRAPLEVRLEVVQLEDRVVPAHLLGTAASFAVLGNETVTNTGPSVISGDVGVYDGTSITGFPPGIVTPPGAFHITDAVAQQAQLDTESAYGTLAGLPCPPGIPPAGNDMTGLNLGGRTLTTGVYCFSSSAQLTGTLTLDFQGNPDAQFVFQIGSTLTTASNASVVMINGGINGDAALHGCEVYWQVGSSATLGTNTRFVGNILARASVGLNTGASIISGRALALDAAVTLDSNRITIAGCGNSSISGLKFEDDNGDGDRDTGENTGLEGLTVIIGGNCDNVLDPGETSVVTDADGNYTFTGLAPGTYCVRQALQSDTVQTTPNPADVSLESNENVTGVDFGDFRLISISGAKFQDDGDGVREDGEPGVQGWIVFIDANGNNELDDGETFTTTDVNGNYTFENLGPGTYVIREVQQDGATQTTANPDDITASSGANVSGVIFGNNFGDFELISISGAKFRDANGNGVRDTGEIGLLGWTIFIDANLNGVLDTGEAQTTTDTLGNYSFENLGPGTYRVREVGQVNWVRTTNNPADIVAASGEDRTDITFGNIPVASLVAPGKRLLISRNLANLQNGTLSRQANFVASLYEELLGRAPDLAGLKRYLKLLQSGVSEQRVRTIFERREL